jgi:hypothetical protein
VGELTISYVLLAEDISVGSSTTNGLPQGIKQIVISCQYWGLKYNLTKGSDFLEKKELKNNERWHMDEQKLGVVREILYP